MPDFDHRTGAQTPVMQVLLLIVTAAVGALATWLFKLDERQFIIIRDAPTRQEIQQLRADLTGRLDRIDVRLTEALEQRRPLSRP